MTSNVMSSGYPSLCGVLDAICAIKQYKPAAVTSRPLKMSIVVNDESPDFGVVPTVRLFIIGYILCAAIAV